MLLVDTKDDAYRWLLIRLLLLLVLREPAQIAFHLALVLGPEGAKLQFDCDEALELPIVEQQIKIEIVIVDLQALLARNKSKPAPSSSRNRVISLRIASSRSRSR